MKRSKKIMGMEVVIEVVDEGISSKVFTAVFHYLESIDNRFSTYKKDSEISKINIGLVDKKNFSPEMQEVFDLSERTRLETNNFFNILNSEGKYDPSGLVKGFAIHNAANILRSFGFKNFLVDIGSDIEVEGKNRHGEPWAIGIKNPFKPEVEIVKVVSLSGRGIATSGKYAKGNHIYNPNNHSDKLNEIVSATVIAKNIYEADRFATAVFAMGKDGIQFLEERDGFEGYLIDREGIATMTSGFNNYVKQYD
jgi:thiamine biosynthesis lipoprotein